jgi:hypothetical protein
VDFGELYDKVIKGLTWLVKIVSRFLMFYSSCNFGSLNWMNILVPSVSEDQWIVASADY